MMLEPSAKNNFLNMIESLRAYLQKNLMSDTEKMLNSTVVTGDVEAGLEFKGKAYAIITPL